MLIIRLQRVGKKKMPTYRLVISEKARDTQDHYLEMLGTFNPHLKENNFLPVADRIKYWLSKGAQTSATINNLLIKAGIMTGKKRKSVFLSKARKNKIAEKSASAKATADKKSAEAAAAPAPAPEVAPQA